MTCEPGRVLGLVGSNGAGKTTVLKALCGLVPLRSGSVEVGEVPVRHGTMPAAVSAMIEEPGFALRSTGWDNLSLVCAGRPGWLGRRAAVLEEIGLAGREKDHVGSYSQGMRQRLGIGRVLLADSAVVVLDEPTNGLDPHGIRWVRDLVQRLRDSGRAVILSSHLLSEVNVLADDITVMAAGRVLVTGPAGQVLTAEATLEQFYFESVAASASARLPE
jgi:ABC-2 type transport system ATP-binding protein